MRKRLRKLPGSNITSKKNRQNPTGTGRLCVPPPTSHQPDANKVVTQNCLYESARPHTFAYKPISHSCRTDTFSANSPSPQARSRPSRASSQRNHVTRHLQKKCTARAVERHSTEISDPLRRAKDILDLHTLQPLTITPEAASRRRRPATVGAPVSHMHASTPACKTQRPHALRPNTPKAHVRRCGSHSDKRCPHVRGDVASSAPKPPPLRQHV